MCMFEQQMPVNVACDKMKARPPGRETNQNAASDKISIRYKKGGGKKDEIGRKTIWDGKYLPIHVWERDHACHLCCTRCVCVCVL